MPPNRPTFLFAFANDAEGSLRLGIEQNACWNELAYLHQEGKIECQRLGFATLEQIYREFNLFHNRIYVFHYGGHSNSEILALQDSDAKTRNFGKKIGQQQNLKLVFLNGCKNYNQVSLLFDYGVPAVIATTAAVEDKRSADFAQQFYQALAAGHSIKEAFISAKAMILDKYPELEPIFRGIGRNSRKDERDFPWGLYLQNEEDGSWSISHLEVESRHEIKQRFREASLQRFRRFTSKGGRFFHLNIEEAILTSLKKVDIPGNKYIDNHLCQDGLASTIGDRITALWDESPRHTILAGPGGMGKTVSLLYLWEKFITSEDDELPVPIFIQMNEFNNRPEKDFIRNYIREHYAGEDFDALLKMNREEEEKSNTPNLILLLDGINEITSNSREWLLEINQLKSFENFPGVQLVLTSRMDIREAFQWQEFHLFELQPLTNAQIGSYLHKEIPTNLRLLEVLRNPMMLSIYGAQSELPMRFHRRGYLKSNISSAGELMYNVEAIQRIKIENTSESDAKEVAHRRFILEILIPFIGWKMQQMGLFFVPESSTATDEHGLWDIISEGIDQLICDDFFKTFPFFSVYLEEERFSGSPRKLFNEIVHNIAITRFSILVKEGENYRFLHQNFRDYFAARHVQNEVDIALQRAKIPRIFHQAPLDLYVRRLLGELEAEHTNKIQWNSERGEWQWSQGDFFLDNRLSGMLDLCKGVFDSSQLGETIWNLITIWHEQRGELSGANLQNLDFSEIKLNQIRFSRPNLAANFSKSKLSDYSFYPEDTIHFSKRSDSNDLIFSPDGKYLVDHVFDWYAVKTGLPVKAPWVHDEVSSLSYNSSGSRALTYSRDGNIKVWNTENEHFIFSLELNEEQLDSAQLSPDGSYVMIYSREKGLQNWDVDSGSLLFSIGSNSNKWLSRIFEMSSLLNLWINRSIQNDPKRIFFIEDPQFSPDGKLILALGDEYKVGVWEASTGACLLRLGNINYVVVKAIFSPNTKQLLTISDHKEIKTWDIANRKCISSLDEKLEDAIFSPDGKWILAEIPAKDGLIGVWNARNGNHFVNLEESEEHDLCEADFSSNSDSIIISNVENNIVNAWDLSTGQAIPILPNEDLQTIKYLGPIPHGIGIFNRSKENTLTIWDVVSQTRLLTLKDLSSRVDEVYYNHQGDLLLTILEDETVQLWDTTTLECLWKKERPYFGIEQLVYSPDQHQILTVSLDNTLKIWDTSTVTYNLILDGFATPIANVAFSPIGKHIFTKEESSTVGVWDITTGNQISSEGLIKKAEQVFEGISSPNKIEITRQVVTGALSEVEELQQLEFSAVWAPDEIHVLIGYDQQLEVWNAATGDRLLQIKEDAEVKAATFNPNQSQILSRSWEQQIKVWHAINGDLLFELNILSDWDQVIYSTKGTYLLVTIKVDQTFSIEIWDTVVWNRLSTIRSKGELEFATFSTDEKYIYTRTYSQEDEAQFSMWYTSTGALISHIDEQHKQFLQIQSVLDYNIIDTGAYWENAFAHQKISDLYSYYRLADAKTGERLLDIKSGSSRIYNAVYNPDEQHILITSEDETASVWDIASGERQFLLLHHSRDLDTIEYIQNGRYILNFTVGRLSLWDANKGTCLRFFDYDNRYIQKFLNHGETHILIKEGNTIKYWEITTGKRLWSSKISPEVEFRNAFSTPDDQHVVVVAFDDEMTPKTTILDAHTGKLVNSLDDMPGLLMLGCDLRDLHGDSVLSPEMIELMGSHGVDL